MRATPSRAALPGQFVLRVRYPPHHHRHHPEQDSDWHAHGGGESLPAEMAELLAWTLRRQGAVVEVQPALRQLALFQSDK